MNETVVMACVGLLIVCIIGAVIGVLITMVIWYMFRHNIDFAEFEFNEEENETE